MRDPAPFRGGDRYPCFLVRQPKQLPQAFRAGGTSCGGIANENHAGRYLRRERGCLHVAARRNQQEPWQFLGSTTDPAASAALKGTVRARVGRAGYHSRQLAVFINQSGQQPAALDCESVIASDNVFCCTIEMYRLSSCVGENHSD